MKRKEALFMAITGLSESSRLPDAFRRGRAAAIAIMKTHEGMMKAR
jgi:hypothetical protein